MILKKYIELENNFFLTKPEHGKPLWEAILLCWLVKIIKPSNRKKYQKRKRWIHPLQAPSKKMVQEEVAKFSRRKDVKLLITWCHERRKEVMPNDGL